MKRFLPWLALLFLLGTGLAVLAGRPEPLDESLFGETLALPHNLNPLEFPRGELELQGRITAHDGAPAADALVVLERARPFEPGPTPVRGAYTDAEGAFRFERLSAGAWRVVLQQVGVPPRSFTIELPAPGPVTWPLAPPLAPIEAMPELVRGALTGRVSAPAGFPLAVTLLGLEVVFVPSAETPLLSGAAVRRVPCDAEGNFALADLVLADYDVHVLPRWARGGSWPELVRQRCAHRADGTRLELVLAAGVVEGTLLEASERPLVGAVVRITSLSAKDALGRPQLWPPAQSDELGRFQSELLPPGRYLLHARAGAGSQDLELEVRAGEVRTAPFAPLAPRTDPAGR